MLDRRTLITAAGAALAGGALPRVARAGATLRPYRSDAEMAAALQRWRDGARRRQADVRRAAPAMANGLAASPMAKMAESAAAADASITNVQVAGVDEGGIVKRHGDHLVILRRGRLFTVRIGGDTLQPVAMADAYAPGGNPGGTWYDELLVSGDTAVVVGYSYARGGTEVGLFDLGRGGTLRHRATYHLKSNDYYSSRNYASRLVGSRLLFYTPTLLQPWGPDPMTVLPGWRPWGAAVPQDFRRILPSTRVYRSDDDFDPDEPLALHTVTSIDLGTGDEPAVESTAVLGPAGRVFHVSAGSVYVWTSTRRSNASAVFRLPLDGSAPTALKTAGVPIDAFSFLESDGRLRVLLRDGGSGEGMWGAERAGAQALALLEVPLQAFGDGSGAARAEHYRRLPGAAGHNRFVGTWLVYGAPGPRQAWAVPLDGGAAQPLAPEHGVERIEALGDDALLVGNAGADLHFSAVRLARGEARLAGHHVQADARQGEARSHGFFYRPGPGGQGLLGLPMAAADGAAVMVLRQQGLRFSALGELRAGASRRDDGCQASCVDWYGNARPIFIGERILALMGYEIVEGRLARGDRLDEVRRISFAPGRGALGRYNPFG